MGPLEFDEWWTVFEDPVLDDLVARAYSQNLSLPVAASLFFPQLQSVHATAGAFKLSDNDPNAFPLDKNFNLTSVWFDAVWELDFWGSPVDLCLMDST